MAFKCSKNIWRKAKKIAEEDYTYCISSSTNKEDYGKAYGDCSEIPEIVAKGKSQDECLVNLKLKARLAIAMILERGEVPPAPGWQYVDEILPPVVDVPPMPKCKPPKEEALEEEMFALNDAPVFAEEEKTCHDCIFKAEADGGDFITCINDHRTGCTLTYAACSYFETDKEIKIKNIDQIRDKLTEDGDFRVGDFDYPYVCRADDDLGFYQQACEFLVHKIEELEKPKPYVIDNKEIQERLTANAGDFDGIVSDMLKSLASIQTCGDGHKFVAASHEYVCPYCVMEKIKLNLS